MQHPVIAKHVPDRWFASNHGNKTIVLAVILYKYYFPRRNCCWIDFSLFNSLSALLLCPKICASGATYLLILLQDIWRLPSRKERLKHIRRDIIHQGLVSSTSDLGFSVETGLSAASSSVQSRKILTTVLIPIILSTSSKSRSYIIVLRSGFEGG